jgi:OCT family organic cation transporter-like MFS transporter 4/5
VIKTVASVGWGVYSMWLQEAFPTLIRGRCYLIAMLFGRVAALFASYLSYFQKRTPLVVEMTLGVAGVLVALGAFPISETQGEPLPQSLEDMEKMGKKTKVTECRLLKVKSERENRNGDDIKA